MDDAIREMTKRIDRMQRDAGRIREFLDVMNYEAYMERITDWKSGFCIIPRRCKLTYKLLWMKPCLVGVYTVPAAFDRFPIKMKFHVDPKEFTMWKLRK